VEVAREMKLSETAKKILERKYLLDGETFNDLCARVSSYIARAEEDRAYWTGKFYQLINEGWFMPGGRILANAGTKNGNLFNCYALEVEDSRDSIYSTLGLAAEIFAHGGGVGYNFSKLRERGTPVSNGSAASGPVSFLELYNVSASVISQASRRGAQLAVLNVDHPDIELFLKAKQVENKLPHFNISVGLTDAFMGAVQKGEKFWLKSRYDNSPVKEVSARKLFSLVAKNAWQRGDPGVLFVDALERDNAVPHLGILNTCNPCGEVPLLPNEACCLGAINLMMMLTFHSGNWKFDMAKLSYAVSIAIRFLDDVHEVNRPITEKIKEASLNTRKLGLGVMGWADMLARMGIPYDSQRARNLAESISKQMRRIAYQTSKLLAEERGPYRAFDPDRSRNIWYPGTPVVPTRNATLMCLAPTGSISLIAGVNSGIEPFFALAYTKLVTEGEGNTKYKVMNVNPYLSDYLETQPKKVRDKVLEIVKEKGSIQEIDFLDNNVKDIFKTAHDISPISHVRMQQAWQLYTDGSISKTVNLPETASVKDVEDIILGGWKAGLKGLTIFRDNCLSFQVLNVGANSGS